ncbi:hypothetical protein BJN45_07365 [Azonexus hydrophilus]|uniref:Uncharacterized protein n=2 Tax=Azonexus hydrophilus TaxID=418702 RepID=A0A1R1I869_9RHOO|nr:hypothetical protein BJN45_07365 [Azonexus hydrophilus]
MLASKWSSLPMILVAMAVLSGCATTEPLVSKDQFLELMTLSSQKADLLADSGKKEEAINLLTDVARAKPDRKEPWVHMAKIHFDAKNYSQAIVSSEEALQRDRADQVAKSIRAVSGLRVAAQSLTELRNDVDLKGGARADATDLAMVMREILGEDVLVPPAELEARKKREAVAARKKAIARAKARTQSATPPGDTSPPKGQATATTGNPFGMLK